MTCRGLGRRVTGRADATSFGHRCPPLTRQRRDFPPRTLCGPLQDAGKDKRLPWRSKRVSLLCGALVGYVSNEFHWLPLVVHERVRAAQFLDGNRPRKALGSWSLPTTCETQGPT